MSPTEDKTTVYTKTVYFISLLWTTSQTIFEK